MFYVAERVFNYKFTPTKPEEIAVFHKDVNVWKVEDTNTNKLIGLWYLDPYAREGKRSGAWANTFRSHTTFDGKSNVLATNNSNFVKPASGEAILVSWDDAITFFHEFGHALHFFSSNVRYPTLNGGVRDYTEFQSQLLERWLSTDEVINNYLIHNKTGKPVFGFYNMKENVTYRFVGQSKPNIVLEATKSIATRRTQYNNLKSRYDSNHNPWKGYQKIKLKELNELN